MHANGVGSHLHLRDALPGQALQGGQLQQLVHPGAVRALGHVLAPPAVEDTPISHTRRAWGAGQHACRSSSLQRRCACSQDAQVRLSRLGPTPQVGRHDETLSSADPPWHLTFQPSRSVSAHTCSCLQGWQTRWCAGGVRGAGQQSRWAGAGPCGRTGWHGTCSRVGSSFDDCKRAEHALQGGPMMAGAVPADAGMQIVHWQAQEQS